MYETDKRHSEIKRVLEAMDKLRRKEPNNEDQSFSLIMVGRSETKFGDYMDYIGRAKTSTFLLVVPTCDAYFLAQDVRDASVEKYGLVEIDSIKYSPVDLIKSWISRKPLPGYALFMLRRSKSL